MADKKAANDPADPTAAPLVSDADDSGQKGTFKDNPDKPDPSSIAQIQVLPDEK